MRQTMRTTMRTTTIKHTTTKYSMTKYAITKYAILLATLFGFNTAYALLLPAHEAQYQLSMGGFPVAKDHRTLTIQNAQFSYTSDAQTTGLASFFVDYSIKARSTFALNEQGVNSLNYRIVEKKDKNYKKDYAITLDSKQNLVKSTATRLQPRPIVWQTKPGNIVDSLSIFLALSHDLAQNPTQQKFVYQLANGESIAQEIYHRESAGEMSINNELVPIIRIDRVSIKKNRSLSAYFSPKHHYLPVLIKQTKNDTENIYSMTQLKISGLPEQILDVSF